MFEKLFAELKGKNALVTGSSRGIGRALALALAEAGVNVAVHYNKNESQAWEVADEIRQMGVESTVVSGNVGIEEDVVRIIKDAEAGLQGTIDILINNAGKGGQKNLEDTTSQEYDETCAINMKSVFLFTQVLAPKMRKKKWGRIVNVSSSASYTGGTSGPHYAGSKAGVVGLTHYYAANLAKDGVTVNCIAPGPIATDMIKDNKLVTGDIVPVKRLGQTEDIVVAVLCLLATGYITGHTLHINGGMYMS